MAAIKMISGQNQRLNSRQIHTLRHSYQQLVSACVLLPTKAKICLCSLALHQINFQHQCQNLSSSHWIPRPRFLAVEGPHIDPPRATVLRHPHSSSHDAI